MSPKLTSNDTGMQLRGAAEDAGWEIRQAAWRLEEGVIWRASDACRVAIRRALRATLPLQRLIQTRFVWPLGDHLDDYGTGVRTAVATAGVVVALGAGAAGAIVSGSDDGATAPGGPAALLAVQPAGAETLQGVTPDFVADPNGVAEKAPPAKAAPPPSGEDATSPDAVAWRFAQAFLSYEVGEVDEKVRRTFKAAATPPLAAALSGEPPRLPAGKEVPQAQVLNVVLGSPEGKKMTASVSLLRLNAASELRLTLQEGEKGWRVVEVLG